MLSQIERGRISTCNAGNKRISFSIAATRPAPCSNNFLVIPPGPGPTSMMNSTKIHRMICHSHEDFENSHWSWFIYYLSIYILFSILPAHATNLLVARGSRRKFCANRRRAGSLYVRSKSAALGVGGNGIFGTKPIIILLSTMNGFVFKQSE